MIYRAIGKAVVKLAVLFVRRRYGRQLRILLAAGAVLVGVAAYLANRDVLEG